MTPYDQARAVYGSETCARSLEADVMLHVQCGYVVSTPSAFALARPVWSYWPHEQMQKPWITAPAGDCWWIWLLCGDATEAIGWLPEIKPFIGFERQNQPRIVRAERFLRLLDRTSLLPKE
jgi:hypothetical protein